MVIGLHRWCYTPRRLSDSQPTIHCAWLGDMSAEPRRPDPFYSSTAWLALRAAHLLRQPSCVACGNDELKNRHVDHIKPRRLFPELELEPTNLRTLCARCHNTHSATQYSAHGCDADGWPTDPTHPWNAGEEARVVRAGATRAPAAWQNGVLRAALERADVQRALAPAPRRPVVELTAADLMAVPR